MKSINAWSWYAGGKHPAVKDFFSIGEEQSIFRAFSDWIQKGYRMHASTRGTHPHTGSWRFWARGPKKQNLVCGLIKDSCDLLGRPHPLLVSGTGALDGWETHWGLLPQALEKTWRQIEYLVTKRVTAFNQMENEIRTLPVPSDNWPELDSDGLSSGHGYTSLGRSDSLLEIMSLPNVALTDPSAQIAGLHAMLKKRLRHAPNAVFMGGIPEKSWLALFKRPLQPDDFVKLWSLSLEETAALI